MKRETTAVITIALALMMIGVLMVYSTSALNEMVGRLLPRHLIYVAVGLCALFVGARFDYHRFRDPLVYRGILLITLGLLVAVLIVGITVDGGRRWIGYGAFRFQPSELAKFAVIVLLAVKLTQNRREITQFWRGFLPPIVLAAIFAGLVLAERDLGVPVVMMAVTFIMMCVAGVRWRYLLVSVVPLTLGIVAAVVYAPHRLQRLLAFLDPWEHRTGHSFQLIQSMSAFAQGGAWGRGAGAGEQKLYYLPASHTDFVFAVVGEELGLVGTLVVVGLFALFMHQAFRIALNASDRFGALLAIGIASLILFQASFIMAVTTGLLPTKGLPLPFISYGGTSLILMLGMVGVLANVGVQAHPPVPARKPHPALAHARA
jgi:cell division protein FtsW